MLVSQVLATCIVQSLVVSEMVFLAIIALVPPFTLESKFFPFDVSISFSFVLSSFPTLCVPVPAPNVFNELLNYVKGYYTRLEPVTSTTRVYL